MSLDPELIRKLAKTTLDTKPKEISCEDWVHRVGEYVEAVAGDAEVDERLAIVERHAAECPSCADEMEILRDLVRGDEA